MSTLLSKLRRERELVRTNGSGAEITFRVGRTVTIDGVRFRVTRHKWVDTTPWATCIVYGRRA